MKIILLLALVGYCVAIPVDNGVEGDPEIECGPTSLTINFNTQNSFEGHVYVKGRYAEAGCRNDEGGRQVAGIELPFDTCGVSRTRSLNPKGVFVSITVIIFFHPQFITKVDRAYKIQCFYMEADKTVSTELEVSMLTTAFQTEVVPMPICRYEILDGGPSGPVVFYALVGQAVYHKWTCDTETVDTFCMVVHSCFVDDGQGDRVDLIGADGCGLDRNLITNLEYPTDLMAGQEAHVFKYADRANLFFNCQITITVKEPNEACPLPQCAEPPARGAGRRRRSVQDLEAAAIVDVTTQDLEVLDLNEDGTVFPSDLRHRAQPRYYMSQTETTTNGFCMSSSGFVLLLALTVVVMVVGTGFLSFFCFNNKSNKQ